MTVEVKSCGAAHQNYQSFEMRDLHWSGRGSRGVLTQNSLPRLESLVDKYVIDSDSFWQGVCVSSNQTKNLRFSEEAKTQLLTAAEQDLEAHQARAPGDLFKVIGVALGTLVLFGPILFGGGSGGSSGGGGTSSSGDSRANDLNRSAQGSFPRVSTNSVWGGEESTAYCTPYGEHVGKYYFEDIVVHKAPPKGVAEVSLSVGAFALLSLVAPPVAITLGGSAVLAGA